MFRFCMVVWISKATNKKFEGEAIGQPWDLEYV